MTCSWESPEGPRWSRVVALTLDDDLVVATCEGHPGPVRLPAHMSIRVRRQIVAGDACDADDESAVEAGMATWYPGDLGAAGSAVVAHASVDGQPRPPAGTDDEMSHYPGLYGGDLDHVVDALGGTPGDLSPADLRTAAFQRSVAARRVPAPEAARPGHPRTTTRTRPTTQSTSRCSTPATSGTWPTAGECRGTPGGHPLRRGRRDRPGPARRDDAGRHGRPGRADRSARWAVLRPRAGARPAAARPADPGRGPALPGGSGRGARPRGGGGPAGGGLPARGRRAAGDRAPGLLGGQPAPGVRADDRLGQTGPWADRVGHDINYSGLAGPWRHTARPGERPVPALNLLADHGGGSTYLVMGVLAGLLEVARTGRGVVVDAAMVDGAANLMSLVHGLRVQGRWPNPPGANILDGGCPFYLE